MPYNDQRNVLAQAVMGQGLGNLLRKEIPRAAAPNQSALPQQPGMMPGTVPSATPPQLNPGLSMPPPQPPQQMQPQSFPPQAPMPPVNPGTPDDFGVGTGASGSIGSKGAGANPPTPATMNAGM